MPHSMFGWSYPPGCSGPPESDDTYVCLCGIPVQWYAYCGPSCERADEEGTVDVDYPNCVVDIPFVLARTFHNPFHIPQNNELCDFQKEDPNAS